MTTPGERPTVLVLRALGLGDLLTAVPALRAVARAFPDHRRVLATPGRLAPLARHTGAVDAVLPAGPLQPLPGSARGPEVAVNLHGRGPQSHRLLLSLHPGRLLAFANADVPGTEALPTWRADEHEVERWSRMLRAFGIAADPSDLDLDRPGLPSPIPAAGATVIHPGAGSAARRWPAERWARVAHRERAAGRRVVVSAGPGERRLAEDVARGPEAPAADVFVGDEDPMPLAALVAEAGRVASSDTGIAHLATALGTPSVVLFGPTPPALWGPPPDRREHRVLWHGSTGDPLGDRPDPGLLRIGVDEVVRALAELPERHAG